MLDQAPSANTYQAGDKVTALVQLASKENVLWLPPDAIRKAGGRTFVIINSETGPKRVDIEIGLQTRNMVEIVSGLEEGQVVVGVMIFNVQSPSPAALSRTVRRR